ncbi:MAG: chemotaxis protein CheX [Sulfurimonas sp.]|uniref:chemotaxis protein CheX n=1 Tax=Sulfurimonas sp. TaxID=2022749 RepID=UPI0025D7D29C|nr:chemotaxis protein CheX [Sulfurimonas sp.]MCK9492262.1 chemotaxis protein CheX [Sulfurimonas sp.]
MQDMLKGLLLPLRDRSAEYLESELEIQTKIQGVSSKIFTNPTSIKNSSLLATTGSIEVYVAMGYDGTLFEEIVKIFLQGDEVEGEELIEIKESISCELINIIVGNAIKNPIDNTSLNITPPLYIDEMSSVFKDKNSKILTTNIETIYGNIYIAITHPFKKSF